MKPVRLQPPPLPPLLRPMRLAVPDFQEVDFPVGLDCSPVISDDESEYYVSNEYHSSTEEDHEGYYSDLESDNTICEGIEFPAVLDALPVKEEIENNEDKIEDGVSNEDENCTEDEGESSGGNLILVRGSDYDSDLEYNELFWETYFQQVDESEGFDIKKYPGRRPLPSYPLLHYLRDRKKRRMLRGYAERALEKYNDDKGTNYVVERILKVKGYGCRDRMYYLIFLAKMGNGSREYIQAMVVKDPEDNLGFPVVMPRVKRARDIW